MKLTISISALLLSGAHAKYTEKTVFAGDSFFSNFTFFTEEDPTKGAVSYQPFDAAIQAGLIGRLSNGHVYMGVDHTNQTPKRPSVRIESKENFNRGLLLADISHMPASVCGTWPAFWMLGAGEWPYNGEIDILEGVNDQEKNAVTLHTTQGCLIDDLNPKSPNANVQSRSGSFAARASNNQRRAEFGFFAGDLKTPDCDVAAKGQSKNAGCSIHAPDTLPTNDSVELNSYGTPFNKNGGGIYAMESTTDGINVWFMPYNASSDLSSPLHPATVFSDPKPETWGTPIARFAGKGCNFEQKFKDLRIIFDTTFCGEWAGKVWEEGGCAKKTGVATCEEWVEKHPEEFKEAYWAVGRLAWYDKEA